MKEKLIIKNFGPIKSVDLDLGKMTILIGEQATGKSTIAKVLAVCRYFSYLVSAVATKEALDNFNTPFDEGLKQWGLSDFIQNGSIIEYENDTYSLKGMGIVGLTKTIKFGIEVPNNKKSHFSINVMGKNEKFNDLFYFIEEYKEKSGLGVLTEMPFSFYRNDVSRVMNNPLYVPTERGLQSIFSIGKSSIQNISDALYNYFAKMYDFLTHFQSETEIKPLEIEYKNVNGQGFIKNKSQTEFSSLYNGASGYQSTIPIVLAIKYYTEKRNKKKTFIIEEPELNLFPKAQKKLMEFFVENINNNGHSFLLPTHSPYIISSINNLMVAYRIGQKHKEKVNEIVEEKYWINPEDVSAYKLVYDEAEGGVVVNKEQGNLILDDLQEISIDYLDGISAEINSVWDKLLQVEDEN